MTHAFFPPLARPISRVVLGTFSLSREHQDHDFALLDEWIRLGGNALDTAAVYGDGESERLIGLFLEATRRRPEVVLITKCCHPKKDGAPRVTPAAIREDLAESLSRLRTDFIDILMLHRDDQSRDVGPIVEALNAELEAGRVRSVGVSNWTVERLQEANDFASRHGMAGFSSSSCQFSLAIQREPLCDGCVSVHAPRELDFHRRTTLPLFAWAALAGGFFTDAGERDPDVERVYASLQNRERRRRAAQAALPLGLSPSQVALAWVLDQGFPVFAIVGSRRVEHLREAARASELALGARELAWLDLEAGPA